MPSNASVIVLFDVDGTLTPSRQKVTPHMQALLRRLRDKATIGFVGGSDLAKQKEQLGSDVLKEFDYCFSENGLTAFRGEQQIGETSFLAHLGERNYQRLVNFVLHYIADLKLPKKRGTFVEFRKGMVNVSPIGRNCSLEERGEFALLDEQLHIRAEMVSALEKEFPDLNLQYSIGGEISIDVFPKGWDKTYCLRYLSDFGEIHFFGDKTAPGGNDFEIYRHEKIIGHTVKGPSDTEAQLKELFFRE